MTAKALGGKDWLHVESEKALALLICCGS